MPAHRRTPIQRERAMFEQRGVVLGNRRLKEVVGLAFGQDRAFEKRNELVQHELVLGGRDILRDGIRQPNPVIGYSRAHALARMRQPPMLDVALGELAALQPARDARA